MLQYLVTTYNGERFGSAPDSFTQEIFELLNPHSNLFGGVSVTDSNGVVLQSVKINGDAIRRANLILGVITLANISSLVPANVKVVGCWLLVVEFKYFINCAGFLNQLRLVGKQRKNRSLVWRQIRF